VCCPNYNTNFGFARLTNSEHNMHTLPSQTDADIHRIHQKHRPMPMPSWNVMPGRAATRRSLPRPPPKPSPAERSARAHSGSAWNVQLPSCVFAAPATSEHGHSAPSIPAIPLPPTTRSAPRNRPVDEDGWAGKTELAKSPGAANARLLRDALLALPRRRASPDRMRTRTPHVTVTTETPTRYV